MDIRKLREKSLRSTDLGDWLEIAWELLKLENWHVQSMNSFAPDEQYIYMIFERLDMDLRSYLRRYGSFQGP